jgi:hypothetical protein
MMIIVCSPHPCGTFSNSVSTPPKIVCTAASIMLPVNVIIEGMSSQDVLGNLTGPLHFKIGGVGGYGV